MSGDVLKRAIKETRESAGTIKTIVIGGVGEPTAHPFFSEYSKMAADGIGFSGDIDFTGGMKPTGGIELTSNAYQWNEDTVKTILAVYKKVTVSVDGLPEFFKKARGFDFEVMTENVKRLDAAKKAAGTKLPAVHAQMVLSRDNLHDVKELIPLLKKTGFSRLVISNLLPQREEDKDRIFYTPYLDEKRRGFVQAWYPTGSANGLPVKIPQTKVSSEHRCGFIEEGALFITAAGDVAPCFRFAHDGIEYVFGRKKKVKAVAFGNIMENTLSEIWNRKDYITFRFQNYASRCPSCIDCDYVEFCDYITTSEADCRANEPSCADCLWCRGLIECP